MGAIKQLLQIADKLAIRRCIDALHTAGVETIILVLGANKKDILPVISGLPVCVTFNERPESEMADSVRTGLSAVDHSSSGVLISLSDHPLVLPETIRSLMSAHHICPGRIIVPAYKGRRGHPCLFPLQVVKRLLPGKTLRDIIQEEPGNVRLVDVPDEGIILDMDTREDYRRICDILKGRQ